MTAKITRLVSALCILCAVLLPRHIAHATVGTWSVKLSCYFGRPLEGVCVGKGVCDDNATDGIGVTFMISKDHPDVLMIVFSLSEMQQKQPDQVAYFTDPSHTYMF